MNPAGRDRLHKLLDEALDIIGAPRPAEHGLMAPASAGADRPHPAEGLTQTFSETWDNGIDWNRWSSVYRWNSLDYEDHPSVPGSSQYGNGEKGWNINRNFPPTADIKPWTVEDGQLVLTADKTPWDLKPLLGYDQEGARNLGWYDYTTGALSTHRSFLQRYGYFEAWLNWSECVGPGLWPAFWLLPHVGKPPEIDVLEVVTVEPDVVWGTAHRTVGAPLNASVRVDPKVSHRLGLMWTPETMTWFMDGEPFHQIPTPDDFHVPMYLILNLAVGGPESWGRQPMPETQLPARFKVGPVRVWALG